MEVTREEMLELAKYETYHLDDRLCPMSREDLRAEAWLQGYGFAKRHQPQADEEVNNAPIAADSLWTQEDKDMVSWLIRCCEREHNDLCNDKYGHEEIVSDLKRDCRKKWDWLEKLQKRMEGDV